MKHSAAVLALLLPAAALVLPAAPALAGGDWYDEDTYDDGYYESRHWRDYRVYSGAPYYRGPRDEVYIPYYGAYVGDEPADYGPNCEVERSYRHGHYREKIECDDD